ncbi:hypothetical protein MUK42_10918 [Musa troglodytarum]|uniref:Uncharacterized protein n=1 Tax=Musa troglodytarum TaxID=320322 RepID=A0A9E7GHQ5_9LILI|nr:hypothetical protein MUK42_10918 [Musa troglodytarum]
MATRSILAEQLKEYQIPFRSDWPTASSNSSSRYSRSARLECGIVVYEIHMGGCDICNMGGFDVCLPCFHWRRGRMCSRNTASQGSEIGPSHENPNSSSDSLRSSWNILALRNAKGTVNLLPSDVYTTKWPLLAIDVFFVLDSREASLLGHEILFRPKAAIFRHFLAISRSLLGLSMKKADAEAMVKCSKWTCGEGAREDTAVAGTWHMVDDLYQHIFFLLLEESFWYTERGKAAVIHQPYRDRNDGKMVEVFLRGLM